MTNPNNPQTPGVYTVEKNAFPPSVAQVPTAIPAFIGYTEKAEYQGKPLINKPTMISSLSEYANYFGGAPAYKFPISKVSNTTDPTKPPTPDQYDFTIAAHYYAVGAASSDTLFYLYNSLRLFYLNGGGQAYIVSVGTYVATESEVAEKQSTAQQPPHPVNRAALFKGLNLLPTIPFPKPTIILIPDAMALSQNDCYMVQQQMIAQAGNLKDRIALLDIHDGYKDYDKSGDNVISRFRDNMGTSNLSYATAYYPWLQTDVVSAEELSPKNLVSLPDELAIGDQEGATYKLIMAALAKQANKLPPAGAMAGIYTLVDNSEGVWIAPANRNINAVIEPLVSINDEQQAPLNVDALAGKSINAIRSFYGRGPAIVWGARTMDGNSLDWKYVNVRRLMIMLEQSVANAAFSLVFEPNDASTWTMCESMISNFLQNLWQEGALQGASPTDAYSVMVGLGKTMTSVDILNGIMRVQIKVAVVRPAEFIIITYEQEMPKS